MTKSGWKRARLGDESIALTASGGTPDRSNPENFGGGIPWVKSGELDDNLILTTAETLTRSGLAGSSAKVFPPGTLLLAMYGAYSGACEYRFRGDVNRDSGRM
jgi:type I restriction enzyme S subunit